MTILLREFEGKKEKKKELLHGRYILGEKRRVSFLKTF